MPIKKYRPTTAGRRNYSVNAFTELTTDTPEKTLLKPLRKSGGRNNNGRITIRHRGGGHKRAYRIIDFKALDKLGMKAVVKTVEYDPNRTAFIALLQYPDGEKRYTLAYHGIKVGDEIVCDTKTEVKPGNRMQIGNIPTSYNIFNIELVPGNGGKMVKTAGTAATLVSLDSEHAQVQLPSGEVRFVPKNAYATIGILSNVDHSLVRIGKAGRKRWLGRKPEVLGKSMNAVDHPHGGGEGHAPIGLKYPKTPWGAPALGVKTRKPRKVSDKMIVVSRHAKKHSI